MRPYRVNRGTRWCQPDISAGGGENRPLVRPWSRDRLRRRQKCAERHVSDASFFLMWLLAWRCGNRPFLDRRGESDEATGVGDVQVLDQLAIDQHDALAFAHCRVMSGNDAARPGDILRRRRKGRIGRGDGLGMDQRLAVKAELASLQT